MTGRNPGDLPLLYLGLLDRREQVRSKADAGDLIGAEEEARELVAEWARISGVRSEQTMRSAIFHCTILARFDPDAAAVTLRDLLDEASLNFGIRSAVATSCAGALASCFPPASPERANVVSKYLVWMLDEAPENLASEQLLIVDMLRK